MRRLFSLLTVALLSLNALAFDSTATPVSPGGVRAVCNHSSVYLESHVNPSMTPGQHLEQLAAAASAARFTGLQNRQGAIANIVAEEEIAKALARLAEAEAELVKLKAELEEAKQSKAEKK